MLGIKYVCSEFDCLETQHLMLIQLVSANIY